MVESAAAAWLQARSTRLAVRDISDPIRAGELLWSGWVRCRVGIVPFAIFQRRARGGHRAGGAVRDISDAGRRGRPAFRDRVAERVGKVPFAVCMDGWSGSVAGARGRRGASGHFGRGSAHELRSRGLLAGWSPICPIRRDAVQYRWAPQPRQTRSASQLKQGSVRHEFGPDRSQRCVKLSCWGIEVRQVNRHREGFFGACADLFQPRQGGGEAG